MTELETLKDAAEKANAYVLRVINAGCGRSAMLKAQAARDKAEADYEAAYRLAELWPTAVEDDSPMRSEDFGIPAPAGFWTTRRDRNGRSTRVFIPVNDKRSS